MLPMAMSWVSGLSRIQRAIGPGRRRNVQVTWRNSRDHLEAGGVDLTAQALHTHELQQVVVLDPVLRAPA